VKGVGRRRPILRMGWMVALALVVPLCLGLWLDYRLGSAPLYVLAGALVGILAATVSTVSIAGREIEALGKPPDTESVTGESQEEDKEDTAQ
jgi:F0F1-type ATP synthase assembly protein I